MGLESWDLWIANRILSSINSKGFISVVTKAERGYGKSMYNLKAMAYVYWSINGNNETDAWNSALDAMIFTPTELSNMVDYNIRNDIVSPVWCIDDAAVHFSSYLHFINLYQAALLNATFDTIRTVTSALLINCPSKKRLLPSLRNYDDYEVTLYKDRGYQRKAVAIKWYSMPSGQKKFRKEWEDYFSCFVPNWIFEKYMLKRKKYLKEINSRLDELRIKLEKKQSNKEVVV